MVSVRMNTQMNQGTKNSSHSTYHPYFNKMSSRAPPAQSRNANLTIDFDDLFDSAMLIVVEEGERELHAQSFKRRFPEEVHDNFGDDMRLLKIWMYRFRKDCLQEGCDVDECKFFRDAKFKSVLSVDYVDYDPNVMDLIL